MYYILYYVILYHILYDKINIIYYIMLYIILYCIQEAFRQPPYGLTIDVQKLAKCRCSTSTWTEVRH